MQADRPELYDAIAPAGREMQEKVIETLGNLEKLTAPTTWVSPQKEVPLEHLAVLPETRVPWKGTFMRPNRVFQSQKSISPEVQERLRKFAMTSGSQVEFDSSGITKLVIPGRAVKSGALDVFSGSAVANATHPVEAEARRARGTGLEEEKTTCLCHRRLYVAARHSITRFLEHSSSPYGACWPGVYASATALCKRFSVGLFPIWLAFFA